MVSAKEYCGDGFCQSFWIGARSVSTAEITNVFCYRPRPLPNYSPHIIKKWISTHPLNFVWHKPGFFPQPPLLNQISFCVIADNLALSECGNGARSNQILYTSLSIHIGRWTCKCIQNKGMHQAENGLLIKSTFKFETDNSKCIYHLGIEQ